MSADRLDCLTAGLTWCWAMIEVIMYPKRSNIRRDTPFRDEPAAQSDRCRIYA